MGGERGKDREEEEKRGRGRRGEKKEKGGKETGEKGEVGGKGVCNSSDSTFPQHCNKQNILMQVTSFHVHVD